MEFSEQENTTFALAAAFVNHTSRHLFLTGKAGTGKTTFLKYIKSSCTKKLAVAAPTGVAAINAGGVTIHSLFQLPFGTYLPTLTNVYPAAENQNVYNKHQLLSKLKIRHSKQQLIRELELLIIDEVSMVRSDTLDAIDEVLRHVRQRPGLPFGGVQMLYIGDLFQLPPVVQNHETRLLSEYYASPFFFDALALKDVQPLYLELKKVYRQSNEQFIQLLNRVRNNEVDNEDLQQINSFYNPDFNPGKEENYITLTSHNAIAERINQQALKELPGKLYSFEAVVERDFPERMFPMEKTLQLKEGAQIMFIKNDKGEDRKFYNGKIGIIESVKDKEIKVRFKDESDLLELKPEKWQNVQYAYNNETDKIDEDELGTFSQYPIRLAWAITIHKSQGLTFDKAVIDAGASFAAGQVYVALSRLRSLDGLVLRSKIFSSAIHSNPSVLGFSSKQIDEQELQDELIDAQKQFVHQSIIKVFEWEKLCALLKDYIEENGTDLFHDEADFVTQLKSAYTKIVQQRTTAERFVKQLDNLLQDAATEGYEQLHSRVSSACEWFEDVLKKEIIEPLNLQLEVLKNRKRTKKLQTQLLDLIIPFERRKQQLQQVITLTETMCRSPKVSDWLQSLQTKKEAIHTEEKQLLSAKTPKGATKQISLDMYQAGKTMDEIAQERNLTKGTIEGHLMTFIPTGEVGISVFVSQDELEELETFMQEKPEASSSEIFSSFNEKYSYTQIRAVRLSSQQEKTKDESQ
ncbi:MAG TPA: helix-turn-helix domain-containing protein [Arachidicoccus sp.]